MAQSSVLGTGGIPNLRVIEDHAYTPPKVFFELHVAIEIKSGSNANDLRTAIGGQFPDKLVTFIGTKGVFVNASVKPKLLNLLKQLYRVRRR